MILLTGGTGLVGAHILLQLCIENKEVKALKRKDSDIKVVRNVFEHYQKKELFEKITQNYSCNANKTLDRASQIIEDCLENNIQIINQKDKYTPSFF